MSLEQRVDKIEEAILIMKNLVVSHENRLDGHGQRLDDHKQQLNDYYKAMRESREDFEFKLNALIDAQIQNEAGIKELKEASKLQLKRIEKIENK